MFFAGQRLSDTNIKKENKNPKKDFKMESLISNDTKQR